jgi:hypothetical protein
MEAAVSRIPIPRAALAAFALLAMPQFASAGPLSWDYRAESPDGTILRHVTGLTDLGWSDFFLPNPELHGTPIPDPHPGNSTHSDVWRSQATVIITDELSGQSGSVLLTLDFVREYEINPDGSFEPIFEGQLGSPWPDPFDLVLGGNTYSVRAPGGEMLVAVTPGPVTATPEPATLALVAFGLGAVGVRLRRFVR